jgi:hypothetical protein
VTGVQTCALPIFAAQERAAAWGPKVFRTLGRPNHS